MSKFTDRTGERHLSNRFGWVEILSYRGKKDCTIRFEDCGTIVEGVQYDAIVRGHVTTNPRKEVNSFQRFTELMESSPVVDIFEFQDVHDYSVKYTSNNGKVLSTCKVCGEKKIVKCEQPLSWKTCDNCFKIAQKQGKALRDEEKRRLRDVALCHKDLEFQKGKLSNLQDGLKFIDELVPHKRVYKFLCSKHGEFSKRLLKISTDRFFCPNCFKDWLKQPEQRVTFEVFLERARKAHGEVFTYNESTWQNIGENVEMTHTVCGNTFFAQAASHINGNYGKPVGCPYCATHGFSKGRSGSLYLLHEPHKGLVKIGVTHQQVVARVRQMTTNSARKYDVHFNWEIITSKLFEDGNSCLQMEAEMHKKLSELGYSNPAYVFDGRTECFECPLEVAQLLFNSYIQ